MENRSDISKNFVPYELALKLKELGFDRECIAYYYGVGKDLYFWNVPEGLRGGKNTTDFKESLPHLPENNCTALLWQQAFDWFTSKGFHSYIEGAYPWFRYYINTEDDRYEGFKHLKLQEARHAWLS